VVLRHGVAGWMQPMGVGRMPALLAWGLGLIFLPLAAAPGAEAQAPKAAIAPLFPVALEHDFESPEETFREVMGLIKENYYTDTVDERSLWWAAIQGMLRHVSPEENPTLGALWLPEQFETVDDTLHGVRESIGIKSTFSPADGSLTVVDVMEDGPSASLLKPLDRIVRIDGKPLQGMAVSDVAKLLEGEAGTRLSLKVIRDVAVFDIDITRKTIQLENVSAEMYPQRVGYLSIRSFSVGVTEQAREELLTFERDGVVLLMLDLRGNTGGALKEGLKFTELFIPQGRSLMRVVTHGSKVSNYLSSNEHAFAFALAVLIDRQTASAGEIAAAALSDEAGATLVGANSFGKATMERIFTLKNDCRTKFTTGALYSPRGKSWQKKGLTPDIAVEMAPGRLAGSRDLLFDVRLLNDPQLRAAHIFLTGPKAPPAPAPAEDIPEPENELPGDAGE